MIKRILSLCLTLMLALALLVGCTPNNTNTGANAPDGANGGVVDGNDTTKGVEPNNGVNGDTALPDDGVAGDADTLDPDTAVR